MPLYMAQFSYTPEAWTAFTKNPENRTAALQKLSQSFGGRLEGLYYSFGDYNGFIMVEAHSPRGMPGHSSGKDTPARPIDVTRMCGHSQRQTAMLSPPKTQYAKSGNVHVAYKVIGDGPLDLVFVPGFVSHLEYQWEHPRPLASSTELAVRQDREQLRSLLSAFFEEMMHPIHAFGGVVEKYAGDAIMAGFGVPQVHEDDAERAVRAAVAMRRSGAPAKSLARSGIVKHQNSLGYLPPLTYLPRRDAPAQSTFAVSYSRMPTSRCDMPRSSFWSEP